MNHETRPLDTAVEIVTEALKPHLNRSASMALLAVKALHDAGFDLTRPSFVPDPDGKYRPNERCPECGGRLVSMGPGIVGCDTCSFGARAAVTNESESSGGQR